MDYIRFNKNNINYDLAISFRPDLGLIQLEGNIPEDSIVSSGFKIVNEQNLVMDSFDDYTTIWEKDVNRVVLSNKSVTYYYYFIPDINGYVVDQMISTQMEDNYAIYKFGKEKEDSILQNYQLFDTDGFPIYKVVNKQVVQTTAEEKEKWMSQWEYSIIFITEDKYVDRYKVIPVNKWEEEKKFKVGKKAVYQTVTLQDRDTSKVTVEIFDTEGFPKYKIIDGVLSEVDATELAELKAEKARLDEEYRQQALIEAKENKLKYLREECGRRITNGIMFNDEHFSYDTTDQNNISNLVVNAKEMNISLPYHADGKSCRLFTKDDLIALYTLQEFNVTYQTTYYNQAKLMVEAMTDWESWDSFNYGDELTGQYLDTFNTMMETAQNIAVTVVGKRIDIKDLVPEEEKEKSEEE